MTFAFFDRQKRKKPIHKNVQLGLLIFIQLRGFACIPFQWEKVYRHAILRAILVL